MVLEACVYISRDFGGMCLYKLQFGRNVSISIYCCISSGISGFIRSATSTLLGLGPSNCLLWFGELPVKENSHIILFIIF
jgi:hypothetical protein